ncbi:MAG TPA: hypothetical protein VFZ83_06380 [Acidimicrobiia bacterium]|nr:hypothetical protein [Acidimicrobiia bacterium]
MGKASRQKRRSAVSAARRSRSNYGWYAATAVVVVLGIVLVVFSAANKKDPVAPFANDDHWHAALGVNVCGTWQPNPPEFEQRFGTQLTAGIHSHGDGLIHIHPYTSDESGENATVGHFLENGGWDVSADSLSVWGGVERTNGEECDGEEASVRWSVNGEEQEGDPADYKPKDLDVVAIAFLPDGDEIGEPPSASNVNTPSDVVGETPETTATTAPTGTTATTAPTGTTVAPTPTTAPGDTTTP